MKRIIALAVILVGVAFAWLKPYEIAPVKPSWSATVSGEGDGVGQTLRCCWDSVKTIHVFIGVVGDTSHHFNVDVYEYPDGITPVAYAYNVAAPVQGHVWLEFGMQTTSGQKFMRGKEYLVNVTRPYDSVNYYWNTDGYAYGHIVDPDAPESRDLAMRVYARAGVGGEFGIHPVMACAESCGVPRIPRDTTNWRTCAARMQEVGARWAQCGYGWKWLQPARDTWQWECADSIIGVLADAGVQPTMQISMCPSAWASSSYLDSTMDSVDSRAIARGLLCGVESESNYVARYAYALAHRYGPRGTFWPYRDSARPIMLFETNSEPTQGGIGRNDSCGWWDTLWINYRPYRDTMDSFIERYGWIEGRKRSFLWVYSKYVIVVDSAVKMAADDLGVPAESIPRTACYIISMPDGEHYTVGEWVAGLSEYGADSFFQVASYHPYRSVEQQEAWLNDTMRYYFGGAGGYAARPFWASEADACIRSGPAWPAGVVKMYATYQYLNATPGYPVEHFDWFSFTKRYNPECGITDTSVQFNSLPPAHAYTQWSGRTKRAWLEDRLAEGVPADARVLQFQDSAGVDFWVAWKPFDSPYTASIYLPAHTDSLVFDSTAYDANPPSDTVGCALDGWAEFDLPERPITIREYGEVNRPNMVTDSVRLVPEYPCVGRPYYIYAWVRNVGSAFPTSMMAVTGMKFYCNGDSIGAMTWDNAEETDVGMVFRFYDSVGLGAQYAGWALFMADANPGQQFVELDMDNNSAYRRTFVTIIPPDTTYFGWDEVGKDTLHRLGCKTGVGAGCTANDTGSFAWGYQNVASGRYSAVSGGSGLTVTGDYSGASGHGSTAATVGQDSLFAFVSQRVAINGTSVDSTEKLKVNGDANVTGILRADSLIGPLNGNAETADSCKGGATRATLADSVVKLPDSITGTAVQVTRVRPGTLYGHTGSGNSVGWDSTSGTAMGSSSARVRAGSLAVGTSGAILADAVVGSTMPIYLYDNSATIGLNAYSTDYGASWKYGEGSSNKYGSFIWQDATNGYLYFYMTNAAGNAGNNATIVWNLALSNAGTLHASGVYGAGVSGRDVYITSGGQFGYNSSSRKVKLDIKDLTDCDWVLRLRPVTFRFDSSKVAGADTLIHYGLIAEEVQEVNPLLVSCDTLGNPETVNYDELGPVLLAKIQQLEKRIAALEAHR